MARAAILLLLCAGFLIIVAPFAVSSLFIDQRGIAISGHVQSKDERVVVRDSSWTRALEVTVEYDPPHEPTVAFLKTRVSPNRYDELKIGDVVQLRYLRREDVPHVPGADVLRRLHLLPTARMADQRAWSGLQLELETVSPVALKVIVGAVLILILWRLARIPRFGWAVTLCVLVALAGVPIHDFPVTVPAPRNGVRRGTGTVKSIDRVEWLLRGDHESFKAEQPIEIVGVQFVPDGRTEAVLAVDLIDAGSLANLREHGPVTIDYEAGAPRTANIHGASRQFVQRNLRGIAAESILTLAVIVILLFVAGLMGKRYRRLTSRKQLDQG